MSLGAFVLVASEFMPVSLLTPIAADAFALIASLGISTLAGKLDRKLLLLGLTLLMIVSGTIAALAPNYPVFMTAAPSLAWPASSAPR